MISIIQTIFLEEDAFDYVLLSYKLNCKSVFRVFIYAVGFHLYAFFDLLFVDELQNHLN